MQSYLTQITSKVSALAKSGRILCARKLFDEMLHRDTIAWNAMLSAYSQLGFHREAVSLFHNMRCSNARLDNYTFTVALSTSAGLQDRVCGEKLHALAFVLGCTLFLPVNNALIDMYGKCKRSQEAWRVFEEIDDVRNDVSWCSILYAHVNTGQFAAARNVFWDMPKRVLVAWNTMISAYAKNGEVEVCFELFRKMLEEGSCRPDHCTLSALMNACAEGSDSSFGNVVRGFVFKTGWSLALEVSNSIISTLAKFGCQNEILKMVESVEALNQVSWNAIIDAHMKTGNSEAAFIAFHQAPEKNVVSWTSMISGFARNGNGEQAIILFANMIRTGIKPDGFTFGAVLHACSTLAALSQGKVVHGIAIQSGFHGYSYVCNGLLNLYAKCGDMTDSYRIFCDISVKDLISWNTMLFALGLYGSSTQALELFEKMVDSGTKPDKVTFIGLLMTCSHSGLVEKGRDVFESMSSVHGISPDNDHVACMVDMLARAGHLKEARELTREHLDSPSVLFGACSGHGDAEMGAELSQEVQILEPGNEMSYVLMSNIYCASGQWKEAERLRQEMADQEVKKLPGISWMEVKNEMVYFFAGTNFDVELKELLSDVLAILDSGMKNPNAIL